MVAITKLADKYTVDPEIGLIDYTACIRAFLEGKGTGRPYSAANTFKATSGTESRTKRGSHPWEFGYNKRSIYDR